MILGSGRKVLHGGSGKRECERSQKRVLDFSASVNPYPPEFSWNCDSFFLEHYPDDSYARLKETIATTFHRRPEEICVGNGSIELIRTCCKVANSGKGRSYYTEIPTFGEYAYSAELYGGTRAERMEDADLLFICNPNNPTGSLRTREEMCSLLARKKKPESLLCVDEAFIELSDPAQSLVTISATDVLILRSLTKCFSVPGIRFGYGFGNPDLIAEIEAARLPWTVNSFAEAFALQAFLRYDELEKSRRRIVKERSFLEKALAASGLSSAPSSANFLLVETGNDVRHLCSNLKEKGILVRDCTSFGLPTKIRVAVRTRPENEILIREIGSCLP